MRISDWSSDVCSSDLAATRRPAEAVAAIGGGFEAVEIAKIIALAASPMTAAILVETHCLIVAFGSSTSILPAPCAGRRTQFTMSTDSPRAAKGAIYNLSTAFSRPEKIGRAHV